MSEAFTDCLQNFGQMIRCQWTFVHLQIRLIGGETFFDEQNKLHEHFAWGNVEFYVFVKLLKTHINIGQVQPLQLLELRN